MRKFLEWLIWTWGTRTPRPIARAALEPLGYQHWEKARAKGYTTMVLG